MDDIEKRLRETTDVCIKSYESWRENKKGPAHEALREAVHDLRKVASRLEIEMAVSERDDMASKPLPIPPHRASRRPRPNGGGEEGMDMDDNAGNVDPQRMAQQQQQGPRRSGPPRSRRPNGPRDSE